jgi:hypothetical protein
MLPGGSVHGADRDARCAVNASKPLQTQFPFLAACPSPLPADRATVLGMLEDEPKAVRVSLGNRKRAWVAQTLGISAPMLSLIAKGERRLPDRLVVAFCYLTGSLLVKQIRDLRESLAVGEQDDAACERRAAISLPRSVAA